MCIEVFYALKKYSFKLFFKKVMSSTPSMSYLSPSSSWTRMLSPSTMTTTRMEEFQSQGQENVPPSWTVLIFVFQFLLCYFCLWKAKAKLLVFHAPMHFLQGYVKLIVLIFFFEKKIWLIQDVPLLKKNYEK